MLKAAAEAAAQSDSKPMVLAVTVLTSMSDGDMQEIGVAGNGAKPGAAIGSTGPNRRMWRLVASAKEAAELRRELGEGFAIVTPGFVRQGPPSETRPGC